MVLEMRWGKNYRPDYSIYSYGMEKRVLPLHHPAPVFFFPTRPAPVIRGLARRCHPFVPIIKRIEISLRLTLRGVEEGR